MAGDGRLRDRVVTGEPAAVTTCDPRGDRVTTSGPTRPTTDDPPPAAGAPVIMFVRHRRARRYLIRVRPDGVVRVTIPRGGSRGEAERFLETQRVWVEKHRRLVAERTPAPIVWRTGDTVLVEGEALMLQVRSGDSGPVVLLGHTAIVVPPGTDDLRPAVQRALWRRAKRDLPPRLHALAAGLGLAVARVSIRNQRARWGSAGPNGHVTLNWRLVQMPPAVRDYVIIHELMHLRRADHSPAFWKLVAAACPGWTDARRWLRETGRLLT